MEFEKFKIKYSLSLHRFLTKNTLAPLLVFSLVSPQVFAAPPIAFGSTGCPNGFVCEDSVVSNGMVQRKIIDNNGSTFYQVSITDGVVNNGGRFTYDSFVNASNGNTLGGISAKLDILQTGDFNLDYTTILNLGWANDGSPAIDFSQTVTDLYQGVGMDYTFSYKQNQTSSGGVTGFSYDIFQRVTNSAVLSTGNGGGEDISTFVLRRAAGDFVNSGSTSLGRSGGGGGGMGRKAILGKVASNGASTGNTISFQNAFVPDANGYGTDGISSGVVGDSQTEPTAGTIYGPDPNPRFGNNLVGQTPNETQVVNESYLSDSVSISTRSTGNIASNGNGTGPAAPTSEVYVATGSSMGMGGGGPSGGTVSWNTGDEIQVLWIGQSCPGCVTVGGGMGGGGSSGQFSFQQYENLTSGSIAASRSISSSAPLNWLADPFGAAPSL